MDYEGQRLAELIFYWIILSFGAVGWVIGYFQQDFMIVFQCWLVGVVISVIVSDEWLSHSVCIFPRFIFFVSLTRFSKLFIALQLCVPDWPFYNRHPVKWLESVPDRRGQKEWIRKQSGRIGWIVYWHVVREVKEMDSLKKTFHFWFLKLEVHNLWINHHQTQS